MTMVILEPVKVAVSLPDQLFQRADALAGRLGVSRSRLYADALAEYLANHTSDGVTEALDALYRDEPATLDHDLARVQASAVGDEDW
jgi:metal-responsive CopG/Arc/MetJ family transcriptional regulator